MKNNIFIISGPSGAGQDSVINGLKKILPIDRVITTTTRPKRVGESQKNPYYFINLNKFKNKIKKGEFFEFAKEYNGHYYGVTHREIKRVIKSKKIGIWKIEYQGVMAAKKLMPDIIAIYVGAPLNILKQRIKKRGGLDKKLIEQRIAYTKKWLKHLDIYDYLITNHEGKLNQTILKVSRLIKTEIKNKLNSIDKN